jgi:uncharacterized damage-inducible protein DinB
LKAAAKAGAKAARNSPAAKTSGRSEASGALDRFLTSFEHEHRTTMNVLVRVPPYDLDFKPHEKSWPARELTWHIAYSQFGLAKVVDTGDFKSYQQPPAPSTLDEIVAGAETYYLLTRELISKFRDEKLDTSILLPNGRTMRSSVLLWNGVLMHQIHHRGQLSVYIRMMGGKVPSIYGPSGDEDPFA